MKAESVNIKAWRVIIIDGSVYVDFRPVPSLSVDVDITARVDWDNPVYCLFQKCGKGASKIYDNLDRASLLKKIVDIAENEPKRPFNTFDITVMHECKLVGFGVTTEYLDAIHILSDLVKDVKTGKRGGAGVYDVELVRVLHDKEGKAIEWTGLEKYSIELEEEK